MARGARWTTFAAAILGTLVLIMNSVTSAATVRAQTVEGTVRITPAISNVTMEQGPVTVFVVLEDLEHIGAISYDNDRDTVPDGEVESLGMAGFQFTISYDANVLVPLAVDRGPGLERTGRSFTCLPPAREPASITFGCVSLGSDPVGPQGTLTLGSATFRPVGPGSSPLLLEADLAGPLGEEVSVGATGGVLRVTGNVTAGGVVTPPFEVAGRPTEGAVRETSTQPVTTPTAARETPSVDRGGADSSNAGGLPVRKRDLGSPSPSGGSSNWSALRWLAVALASLTAAGALGLGALLWRRHE